MSLENIIGLSKNPCSCLDAFVPEEGGSNFEQLNTSYSGLYTEGSEFTIPLKDDIFNDCKNSDIWNTLIQSRSEGMSNLNTHLLHEIGNYQTALFGNIKDTFGQKKSYTTNINSLNGQFVGHRYKPNRPRSTVLNIRRVNLFIAEAGTYTIHLYRLDPNTHVLTSLHNVEFTGGSNTGNYVDFNYSHKFTGNETLFLIYDRQDGFPINSEVYCPTCTGSRPYYTKYLQVDGVNVSSLDDLHDTTTSKLSMGLFVEFSYQCDYLGWLEEVYTDFWTTTSFGRLYSKLFEMYASKALNEKILLSQQVNYYTLTQGDNIMALNDKIQGLLNELVPTLAEELPDDFADCFKCKSQHEMSIRTLTT